MQVATSFVRWTTGVRHSVSSKLIAGDVPAAVRVATSDNCIIEPTPVVLEALTMNHPSPPLDKQTAASVSMPTPTELSTDDVRAVLTSFHLCSAGSIDVLRHGHLKYFTCRQTAKAGIHFNQSVYALCTKLCSGNIPNDVRNILYFGKLTALR